MITGLTRSQERDAQLRLLDALEGRSEARIRAEIQREAARMAEGLRTGGALPADDGEHAARIFGIIRDSALVTVRTFGARILDQGKSMGALERKDIESFAEFFARIAGEWITQEIVRERIVNIASTTREQITAMISQGYESGLSVEQIAASITQRTPKISRYRAHVIARTETHGAANYGAFQSAAHTGLDMGKEWLSVHDARTRSFSGEDVAEYDHKSMDGQKVDMDAAFLMPWAKGDPIQIMMPGEAGQPAAAVIMCRCGVGYFVKGFE